MAGITLSLTGSRSMPFSTNHERKNFQEDTPKPHFKGHLSLLPASYKHFAQIIYMLIDFLALQR